MSSLGAVGFLDPCSSLLTFIADHFIFSDSTPREELCCVLASKESISIYEQEDNFSKPKQDECRLCPKDENIGK